jgi:hypothetical protein
MTALFIHVAYRIGSCRQQIHLMLFKADGLVEKQTVEGFIMQIFSHIEVQLLFNDNNVIRKYSMYNKQKHDLSYVGRFHLKHIIAVEHNNQQIFCLVRNELKYGNSSENNT